MGYEDKSTGGNSEMNFLIKKDTWKKKKTWEFPDRPVVKTRHFQGKGVDLIPCWETEILPAM